MAVKSPSNGPSGVDPRAAAGGAPAADSGAAAGVSTPPLFRPGLEGVPATQSAICDIDGIRGLLTYRGYPLEQLAANSTFLETAYLLIWGELPTIFQLRDFEQQVQT
jgi:citrate synthase